MSRVLLIDDDEQILKVFQKMLAGEGYEVIVATNGRQGRELFREHGADLIITDIVMPEKEGIEIIMELRRDYPGLSIIAISGGGQTFGPDSYLDVAQSLGVNKTLQKPIHRRDLLAAVREQIGRIVD